MSKRKGLSFDEKKSTLLSAMQAEAAFFTLKELETLGKSKGVIPQAVKEVVESLVADDEVQSDKVGSQILFWALPSQRTATLQNKRQKLQAETNQLQSELQKLQGSRMHLGRCSSAPVPIGPKAGSMYCACFDLERDCGGFVTDASSDDEFVFSKPPFLFSEPPRSHLFQLKHSLLMGDEGIEEVPPVLGSGEWERQLLMAEEEPPQPAKRPEMPSRLRRQDMAPKSRARMPPAFLQAARHDGLHRVKSPSREMELKFSLPLTYYSVETCSDWQMPKRSTYKSPKSRRPLEGLGGRVKPGVYRQPGHLPVESPACEIDTSRQFHESEMFTSSPGSPCTPF
ncbi:unnamed protein product [Effrenium voratum]|nr:unnamed protein product [Effrenium voratum]